VESGPAQFERSPNSLSARKTELEKRPTNIIPILQESLKLLRSSIPTSIEFRHIITKDVSTILVDSEIGKGTTFNIFFPIIEKEPAPETPLDKDHPTGKERILFVDDEESLVKMGSQRLERLGYHVETTTSSMEALELFRSRPDQFDLVITDLTMPKMTGDKLLKEILDIRSEIPIILCTGYSEKVDGEKAREMGAAGYIEKPVDNRELTIAVRKALDKIH